MPTPIYKIFSDNGERASRASLKCAIPQIDKYQYGYYVTEVAVKSALAEIAEVHRKEGREVLDNISPRALPSDCDPADCVGYLLVLDKVGREWRWWAMRIPAVEFDFDLISQCVHLFWWYMGMRMEDLSELLKNPILSQWRNSAASSAAEKVGDEKHGNRRKAEIPKLDLLSQAQNLMLQYAA